MGMVCLRRKRELKDQDIAQLAGKRSENVYAARGLCCSESVVYVLNGAFAGGLSPEMAVRLATGFCHGMGGGDCVCGALGGAQMGLGLLLAPGQAGGMKKKEFEKLSRNLHDRFRERFGTTCCRLLRARGKEKTGPSCKELTGGSAEMASRLLLEAKPELAARVNSGFLEKHDVRAGRVEGDHSASPEI
jgi:C_GCAxxG_C_C family probable redox protein